MPQAWRKPRQACAWDPCLYYTHARSTLLGSRDLGCWLVTLTSVLVKVERGCCLTRGTVSSLYVTRMGSLLAVDYQSHLVVTCEVAVSLPTW